MISKDQVNQLVKAIGNGDEVAFNTLYEGLKKPLLNFVIPIINNSEDAKDIVHDVFAIVIRKSKGKIYYKNCFGWIFTIAKSNALNYIRRRKVEEQKTKIKKIEFKEEQDNQNLIAKSSIKAAISFLTTEEQQLLRLYYTDRYTYLELAEIFKTSQSGIKREMYAILDKLKKILEVLDEKPL